MTTELRRSPLPKPPLRAPGQSVDDRITFDVLPTLLGWWGGATFAVLLAAVEWIRFGGSGSASPKSLTVVALVLTGLAALRTRRHLATARRLAMARDGERTVGDMLQELVAQGWHVFHDIPGPGFNVDHVAIGPASILAFETKTRRKPVGRNATIVVEEHGIAIDGHPIGWEPVEQAARQAAWLERTLEEWTGRTFAVRPVVLFPGWFIDDRRRHKDPWVLGYRELPKWLGREDHTLLTRDEMTLASSHLDRHVRTASAQPPT